MMRSKLTVVIPSRSSNSQLYYLKRATDSVRRQSVASEYEISLVIGVDQGCVLDSDHVKSLGAICVESQLKGQAAALNSALIKVEDGFVAFLEDDDEWMPDFLKFARASLKYSDFVSSTQFEVDESGQLLRINDFPTPSGWFMPVSTLKAVGNFNEAFRFHLDNEWLGRLAERKLRRVHMVESTAPISARYLNQVRPWLFNVLKNSGGLCQLARHSSPFPLIKRLVHSKSGMAMISKNDDLTRVSREECQNLASRFGRIPW